MTIEGDFSNLLKADELARKHMDPDLLAILESYDSQYSFTLAAKGVDELSDEEEKALRESIPGISKAVNQYHDYFDQFKRIK